MEKQEIDFYQYGARTSSDVYANAREIAKKIEKEYGTDARLEFECGLSVALNSYVSVSVEENVNKYLYSKGYLDTASNMRNNSYFGGTGISRQYDDQGYNEPTIK